MDATNLDELCQHFTAKISGLCEALAIQSSLESVDEDVQEESFQSMQTLWQEVDEMSDILTLLRTKCADQTKALANVKAVKEKLQSLIKGTQYTSNNIPPHLPTVPAAAVHESSSREAQNKVSDTVQLKPQAPADSVSVDNKAPTQTAATSNTNVSKQPCQPSPLIEYLTVDEFNNVPKYMKGRSSYQQVNRVIDELNKAFTAKYKLFKQKKSTMNDVNRKRYEALRMQETKDTKGVYFVVDKDITEWSSLKMSRETHSLMTVLRHCGRLREIRGNGCVRFAIIEMY